MTSFFNCITDDFWASPQITCAQIADIKKAGFDLIINNRPDGEAPGQPSNHDIQTEAKAAGINYLYIPIGRGGISEADIEAFVQATANATKTLGFCRTGTRSTIIRSLAAARAGDPIENILRDAARGGYDLTGHIEQLKNAAIKA
ncbi:MAG: TIGR01244 family sulfur transferase [Parvularculaceae bacterium]